MDSWFMKILGVLPQTITLNIRSYNNEIHIPKKSAHKIYHAIRATRQTGAGGHSLRTSAAIVRSLHSSMCATHHGADAVGPPTRPPPTPPPPPPVAAPPPGATPPPGTGHAMRMPCKADAVAVPPPMVPGDAAAPPGTPASGERSVASAAAFFVDSSDSVHISSRILSR